MITVSKKSQEQFLTILKEKRISPVYQPIVSLEDGEIFGYEGLSRIDLVGCEFNTEEMFLISEKLNKVWELEELCRIKTLQNAVEKPEWKKLFINVDPKVIRDEKFRNGITVKYLKMYGLAPKDIVFEITERSSIGDAEAFEKTVQHYKSQDYQIAIDDFGSGYAGLRRVCALSTNYLKIDMASFLKKRLFVPFIRKMPPCKCITTGICISLHHRLIKYSRKTPLEFNGRF